ncbi:MAG: transposase [Cyanobacteria bacterium P01_C01_bin.147]
MRHLQGVCEAVGAILQSQQAAPARWLPYLSHRRCGARAHREPLQYLLENQHISAERFYQPLLQRVLAAFAHTAVTLALDTSVLWNQYCLVEGSLMWDGRSLTIAQTVLEHPSASVAFEDYQTVLKQAYTRLPTGCEVTLLADRGFDHKQLLRWLQTHQWDWMIRLKGDVALRLATGRPCPVDDLWPPSDEAYFYRHVEVDDEIPAHLATAQLSTASEPWAVFSSAAPSLHTFARYGERFGGIEPQVKDDKSAGFHLPQSRRRNAQQRIWEGRSRDGGGDRDCRGDWGCDRSYSFTLAKPLPETRRHLQK